MRVGGVGRSSLLLFATFLPLCVENEGGMMGTSVERRATPFVPAFLSN